MFDKNICVDINFLHNFSDFTMKKESGTNFWQKNQAGLLTVDWLACCIQTEVCVCKIRKN